jgi:hypothetical protein
VPLKISLDAVLLEKCQKVNVQRHYFASEKLFTYLDGLNGAIKSLAYREPGKRSRKRSIDKDSIDAYLEQQAAKEYAKQQAQRVATAAKALAGDKAAA